MAGRSAGEGFGIRGRCGKKGIWAVLMEKFSGAMTGGAPGT
ncbi:MAG: hypothetical protein Q4C47_02105 [Planctomycetia bacterium]|nr:hypothetical protein [Planctomycetia bacterium]